VGNGIETTLRPAESPGPAVSLRLFGPLSVLHDGEAIALPPSRKARALLAFLAVSPHPVSRSRLCELLWDLPNDPRAELRWCLTKLRALLDTGDRRRVTTASDRIGLDLSDCDVDARDVAAAVQAGLDGIELDTLRALAGRCAGEFLQGIEIDHSQEFEQWLAGRRSEFRSNLIDIAASIGRRTPVGGAEGLAAARAWLGLAPLDIAAHARFLDELWTRRMIDDCNRHIAAAQRLFEEERVDFAPVRKAFERLRAEQPTIVATVATAVVAEIAPPPSPLIEGVRRASVAVMPFRERAEGGRGRFGDGLTHDVISRLARLRSLFVIARGSVFALADENLDPSEIGRRLGVVYVATGTIEEHGGTIRVSAEVVEAASAHILWTHDFEGAADNRLAVLDEIGDGIVAAIATEIETAERNRAVLKPPESLDAWEAYHRGLWHMYRFTREENARAAGFFDLSTKLDPTFSRAHAGRSFVHWQNAFQGWGDRAAETRLALDTAGQSLFIDDHNPTAHWSMGRALWLAGDPGGAVSELERSVALSPNYALGHYALSFVNSQTGDPEAAVRSADYSRLLSPFDPMLFGMMASRAMALVRLGKYEEAADWAIRASARPNAHTIILAIAAHCLELAGRNQEARQFAARIAAQNPGFRAGTFLETFRFDAESSKLFRAAASRIGLPE